MAYRIPVVIAGSLHAYREYIRNSLNREIIALEYIGDSRLLAKLVPRFLNLVAPLVGCRAIANQNNTRLAQYKSRVVTGLRANINATKLPLRLTVVLHHTEFAEIIVQLRGSQA